MYFLIYIFSLTVYFNSILAFRLAIRECNPSASDKLLVVSDKLLCSASSIRPLRFDVLGSIAKCQGQRKGTHMFVEECEEPEQPEHNPNTC